MLFGTWQLALLSFATLFIWVPFALAGWALDRREARLRRRAVVQAERLFPALIGDVVSPVPLPSQ